MHVLREAVSKAGHPVLLAQELGSYAGAQPYYTVMLVPPSGEKNALRRYTPNLERAEFLFDKFLHDITDPEHLKGDTP